MSIVVNEPFLTMFSDGDHLAINVVTVFVPVVTQVPSLCLRLGGVHNRMHPWIDNCDISVFAEPYLSKLSQSRRPGFGHTHDSPASKVCIVLRDARCKVRGLAKREFALTKAGNTILQHTEGGHRDQAN